MAKIKPTQIVLEHLKKHGYITMDDADRIIPYGYLPSVIARLRRDGHRIVSERKNKDRYSWGNVVYKLIESEEKDA